MMKGLLDSPTAVTAMSQVCNIIYMFPVVERRSLEAVDNCVISLTSSQLPSRPVDQAAAAACCCYWCWSLLQAGLRKAVDAGLRQGWVPTGALYSMTTLQKALKS